MTGEFFGALVVLYFVVRLIYEPFRLHNEKKEAERARINAASRHVAALKALSGFNSDVEFIGETNEDAFAIDTTSRQIAISKSGEPAMLVAFDQVLTAQLLKDGEAVGHTSLANNAAGTAAGAVIGGVLLGGLGVLAGMLAGSQRGFKTVKRLSLKLQTTDIRSPVIEIVMFDHAKGLPAKDDALKKRIALVDEWFARVQIVLSGKTNSQRLA